MEHSMNEGTKPQSESDEHGRDGVETVASAAFEAVFADRQRTVIAGMLDTADAIDAARDSLSRAKRDEAAKAAEAAARWLQDYANELARSGPDRLMASAEDMARRNPALFVGGAAALGAAVMWRLQSGGSVLPGGAEDAPDAETKKDKDAA